MKIPYNILVILGPTASGKTKLAVQLAHTLNTEIISADSRQVFTDMNIGTGKDLEDYKIKDKQVPYHLIDIKNAGTEYNLNEYLNDFKAVFKTITEKNKIPILCGGSALYIDAVLKDFEYTEIPVNDALRKKLQSKPIATLRNIFRDLPPSGYQSIADLSTHKRCVRAIEITQWLNTHDHDPSDSALHLKPLTFGIASERNSRRNRIEERLKNRLNNGLIEEVKSLLDGGIPPSKLIFYGLEYKYVVMYLQDEINYKYLTEHLAIAIQQFAKRQMTYFRKMEREGLSINWIDADLSLEEQLEKITGVINNQ